jgi:hypothetical protein
LRFSSGEFIRSSGRTARDLAEFAMNVDRPGSRPVVRAGCGRTGAWSAAHALTAESAQADFAFFQRRIHSLQRADGT